MAHYGGHWRDAFTRWLDLDMPAMTIVEIDYRGRIWPAEKLLGRMVHCTDILPGDYCEQLDIYPGSTYAGAAQMLLAERRA